MKGKDPILGACLKARLHSDVGSIWILQRTNLAAGSSILQKHNTVAFEVI